MAQWDSWVEAALAVLASKLVLRSVWPVTLSAPAPSCDPMAELETYDGPGPWDRSSMELALDPTTARLWLSEGDAAEVSVKAEKVGRKVMVFSGNDYLALSTHPAVRKAAAKAAQEYGMGPRASSMVCGHTNYHRKLEDSLAELLRKENCVLCPTGFSANMSFVSALGTISSLLSRRRKPSKEKRIAIFSDAFNHASIVDGIRLVERQQQAQIFIYKHCDMAHLDFLLSRCSLEMKVVITDSVFSMEGDFAPLPEIVVLRRKHGFLLVIDDAHSVLTCGDNGGGASELFGCEKEVDICTGSLSKAAGCQGGFVACSNKWKQLIQGHGRQYTFSTALPVPVVCAIQAALHVARKEKWRKEALWSRVHEFRSLTQLTATSPVISVVVGTIDAAIRASRHMMTSGFHVVAMVPPVVAPDSCRLRISLSAAHSSEDIRRLVAALTPWVKSTCGDRNLDATPKL